MTTIVSSALLAGRFGDAAAATTEKLRRGVAVVRGSRGGAGAGAAWRADGLVITNNHVATGYTATVIFADGVEHHATVVARDPSVDLAALQVEGAAVPVLAVGDSDRLKVGQLVLAVGNPFGEMRAVTAGIISAVGRGLTGGPVRLSQAVQANITLLPGNSGGPLADAEGRVIGINAMVLGPGVSIAVPSNTVERFLAERAPGSPVLGIAGQPVDLPEPEGAGVLIAEVADGSAAASAGLMIGDVLLTIDGTPARDGETLSRALGRQAPGQPRRVTFLRGGRRRETTVRPQPRQVAA